MAATETDHRFWDCECSQYYIHAKIKKEEDCHNCGAYEDEQPDCGFPIFYNFEAAYNITYGQETKERDIGDYGVERKPVGGVESISLECWMVEQTTMAFQQYMADYLLGPLGKQGTLNLNGNITENAILTSISSDEQIGASLRYVLEFQATLAC